jgi:hypothetical protein
MRRCQAARSARKKRQPRAARARVKTAAGVAAEKMGRLASDVVGTTAAARRGWMRTAEAATTMPAVTRRVRVRNPSENRRERKR